MHFGWWSLHLAFSLQLPYTVKTSVAARVDAVEKIVGANLALPEREKQRAATFGAELGNIADAR